MATGEYREQVEGPMLPGLGYDLVLMLESRNGRLTLIQLAGGQVIRAFNSAYGRDLGEEWEHTLLNGSPIVDGEPLEWVKTSDIVRVIDPSTQDVLYQRATDEMSFG